MSDSERHAEQLPGLHREIWEGVDPDEYLERERASWEAGACGRPGRPGEKAEGSRNRPALRKYARREVRRFLEADRVDEATARKVEQLLPEPVPTGEGEPGPAEAAPPAQAEVVLRDEG